MLKIIERKAKSIFTKSGISDYSINQYVGCSYGRLYCYAKFICKWKNYGFWGSWVEVKKNAPELVKEKFIDGEVFMSSVSDPYQPIEKNLMVTRNVLKNMNKNIKLTILTKSDLVIRDIKLFKEFKNIEVGLTINGFNNEVKSFLEQNTPPNKNRVKALKVLCNNKIKNYCFISPIIPKLVDIKSVVEETLEFTKDYWFEFLNAKLAGNYFLRVLKENFPESYNIICDKQKFLDFIEKTKNEIQNFSIEKKIKINGVIVH